MRGKSLGAAPAVELNHQIGGVSVLFSGRVDPRLDPRDRLAQLGVDQLTLPTGVVLNRQVHGAAVVPAELSRTQEADGLVTGARRMALALVTADCLPVLLVGPRAERIAAVHAGWRGLAAGILSVAVDQLLKGFHEQEAATAFIGPAIGPCCYEVGWAVAHSIAAVSGPLALLPGRQATSPPARPHLDLRHAAFCQLRDSGIADVRVSTTCTRCDRGWCSYRRDGAGSGHNVAYIWRS